jgi:hypothetical protein
MKAKELMVGDWIRIDEPDKYAGATGQIQSLMYHREGDAAYFHVFIQGKFGYLSRDVCSDDIRPIPLTAEILEKNGFKRDPLWHHCDKDLDNYSISVQLGYANKIEYIKIAEKGKDNVIPSERTKMYLTHIKYLHQLQHALRLCGIELDILV